jgi:hypothetical protein
MITSAKAGELKLIQENDSELAKELDLDYTPSFDLPAPFLASHEPTATSFSKRTETSRSLRAVVYTTSR